ncbi:unnamed protein product [Rotaria sordida]|uniref:Pentatricopeptide repeat-containing protein n=1 Tax=Rotaria sordida TaxID=392033 RepID=A0A814E812_9BILA|nr:unnamed protein product [Rotaria sordida]CAF1214518.1 unnamed protein product [Rotaria sordida]CAF1351728.1 unnamed protein product [Rotaria sordida]CAF1576002.1 unnamed protein product [Rotaria sordida]CAF3647227.1 unnamed protein product [Rotaria sordida]
MWFNRKAQNVFESVVDRDAITYTAMINAFGLNGMDSEAIQLYRKMSNNLLNEISHICVLNACFHSGLLQKAWNIFNDIPLKTEKIFTTMIFKAHNHSRPKSSAILSECDRLRSELIVYGYKYDPSRVTRQLKEEATNLSALYDHGDAVIVLK